ncbi:MAG: hypothetical protein IJ545_06865 [Alphaproteobacteria bacterium]|nr:hypothetical protein [Alphaproteobacteria bacterium]
MAHKFDIQTVFKVNDQASGVLKNVGKVGQSLTRQFGRATSAINGTIKSVSGLIAPLGVISGLAGAGFVKGIAGAREYANAVADMTERLGVSAKFLQEQHYISKLNAGSAEEVNEALAKLSKQYGALKTNTGALYAGLQKISPALLNQLKGAKSNEEAFNLMIKAIRKVEDPAKKLYLSQLAFGTAGKAMINIANQSEESLDALRKEANAAGLVMDTETVKGAQELGDSFTDLREHIRGVFNQITGKLIPILIPFIKRITEWIKANRELIGTKVNQFVEQFAAVLKKIDIEKILNGLSAFATGILKVTDVIAGLNKWVLLLGVAMYTGFICNAAKAVKEVWTLLEIIPGLGKALAFLRTGFIKLGLAILTTPIGWFIAGTAALVGAFVYLWKNCEGFRNFFISIWDGVKKAWDAFIEYGSAFLEGFLAPFKAVGEWLGEKFVDIFDVIAGKIKSFVKIWTDAWDGIKNGIKATVDFIVKVIDAILSPIETLKKGLSFIKDAGGWVANKLGFGGENIENDYDGDENTYNTYNNSRSFRNIYNSEDGDTIYNNDSEGDITNNYNNSRNEYMYNTYNNAGAKNNICNNEDGDTINNYYNRRTDNNTYNNLQQAQTPATLSQYYAPQQTQKSSAKVEVSFKNMPKEASVDTISEDGPLDLGVEYGYAW